MATGAGKSLAMCFGAIVALSKSIEDAQSVRGVTNGGARDQVVKPVLQCLLSGQMT